jgi:hypothetical protein
MESVGQPIGFLLLLALKSKLPIARRQVKIEILA